MTSAYPSRTRAPASPLRGSRLLAGRLKVAAVAASVAGFGAFWTLVSLNVVGATNQPAQTTGGASVPANVPSNQFFSQAQQQPQPRLFSNGSAGGGFGNGPVFHTRTS